MAIHRTLWCEATNPQQSLRTDIDAALAALGADELILRQKSAIFSANKSPIRRVVIGGVVAFGFLGSEILIAGQFQIIH